jgi:DNA modification methylase
MAENKLYYGDNLEVLRRYVKDETVDLVYLDPPFNSRQDYNVLFAEKDGTRAASQIQAFEDTWEWNAESKRVYEELVERGDRVSDVMRAFHTFLLNSDMMAYLAMMAPRLIELHRVLKVTGSIYLHCDPTASHYLKMLMDAIFGAREYRNEIIWERTTGRKAGRQFGRVHDTILFYTKGDDATWNPPTIPQTEDNARGHDIVRDENGTPYRMSDPTGAGQGPARVFWGKLVAPPKGRHWAYDQQGIDDLISRGRIVMSARGNPRLRTPLSELTGVAVRDIWTDIEPINSAAAERLGYPTQKPEALLERIINTSSNEGDVVLDPFCGCGTAVSAAQKLNRRWIGIDVTHLAIGLIKTRLQDAFGPEVTKAYDVIGEPEDLESAKALALQERFQFQSWALGLVGARNAHSAKKGSDRGIDGKLYFRDDANGEQKQIILSVKSGGVQVRDVRDLVGTIEREKAQIGVFITLEEPSKPMLREAVDAGFYKSPNFKDQVPRIQIRTIEELLAGGGIQYPRLVDVTFKPAPKAKGAAAENLTLSLGDPE